MDWHEARTFVEAAVSIFAIANPIGGLPVFVGLTEELDTLERRRLFRLAGLTALAVICVMAVIGQVLLQYVFHISMNEFSFGGGLLLMIIGIRSILSEPSARYLAAAGDPNVLQSDRLRLAVTPIAVPLLVGPGSIVNVMLLARRHNPVYAVAACLAAFVFVILILNYAHLVYRLVGKLGALAVGRVMQIFIVAIGVKFCFDAIKAAFPAIVK